MSIRIYNTRSATEVASILLSVGAVKLRPKHPFTWASGWKSPIYCDNRLSLSFPEARSKIKRLLNSAVADAFDEVDVIAGVATAGIPQGTLVADALNLPFLYIRSQSKGHGLQNTIEGNVEKGQKVVLIEDLVSTGGSSLAAADALIKVGTDVKGVVSVFTYGFPLAEARFKNKHIDLVALSDYSHLLEHTKEQKLFEDEVFDTLREWRVDPGNWKG